MLQPNMTDGQVKEFELVDFAEKLQNIQKDFNSGGLGVRYML